ncbi:MAG: hypothetical protein K8R79_01685 [Calditrichales bacterium]|nr:hypothetical protein [Calditrichales bacterium]
MNYIIKTTKNNAEIIGKIIYRTRNVIEVQLLSPFSEMSLRNVSHITCFADHNFFSEYGEKTALSLLRELCDIALFIDDNKHSLLHQYGYIKLQIKNLDKIRYINEKRFLEKRKILIDDLESGKLKTDEYQRGLNRISKKLKMYLEKKDMIENEYFKKYFHKSTPYYIRSQIIEILSKYIFIEGS